MDDGLMMNALHWDIIELAGHLRQERLFVSSEQQHLQGLNEKVISGSCRLAQLAWVTAQQRDNLNRLIVAHPDCTPAVCCRKANTLDSTVFVDGYKVLGFQECLAYGEFLQTLRTSPQLLASCLVAGDRLLPDMMHGIVHSIMTGLFGSSLLPEDKLLALRLLRYLTELQLVPSENPRRLLRQRSCAFARLYGEFHEGLFSAKLFLTAALHKPIMQLLVEDEMFLDIDPDKATIRFPPEERLKKFGPEGSPEYNIRLQEYRRWTNKRLVAITNRFVLSLRNNMHCFPTGVRWLVCQIAGLLSKSGNIEPKEVNAICTDLVFTYFICPAIVNPEPYGITDAPISYVSCFNLIQVAKIVQMLAMTKYEDVDSKVSDLYNLFEKDCVSSLLDAILDGATDGLEDGPVITVCSKLQGLSRSAALFTETELHQLVVFLQTVSTDEDESLEENRKQLTTLLMQLPFGNTTVNGHVTGGVLKPQQPATPSTPRKSAGLLGIVGKGRVARTSSSPASSTTVEGTEESIGGEEDNGERGSQDVLVIPFTPNVGESVGLIAEQKILCMEEHSSCAEARVRVNLPDSQEERSGGEGGNVGERVESQEKRTRFSLSHDEGSIGNASDNLEAVSEAASNHSVASSLELENDQNDNLSDMVSANVSGRGTPNISGRDTPSSQITEGEEGPGGVLRGPAGEPRQPLDFPPPPPNKQSRSDIDDKFGKFEIKKLLEGDETVSMVSDTWSTDVLASDSETVEQSSERNFPTNTTDGAVNQLAETQLLDVSETASEAWSTDVLASDSERLTEVDTDDTGSVARSDDTARSEVEVEGRGEPEGGEDATTSTAPLGVNLGFRPIREDPVGRASFLAPSSPTRVEGGSHPAWNVTGRGGGKADYRRRTVEYVANNPAHRSHVPIDFNKHGCQSTTEETRLIHVIDKIDKPLDLKPAVVAASQASVSIVHIPGSVTLPVLHNGHNASTAHLPQNGELDPSHPPPLLSSHVATNTVPMVHIQANHASAQSIGVTSHIHPHLPSTAHHVGDGSTANADADQKPEIHGEEEADRDSVGDIIPSVVRLSSTSLASTSSSGSGSDPRPKTVTPTPDLPLTPTTLVLNGHAMMADGEVTVTKPQSAGSSTGAIPKSISFDKTAERGDKDLLDDDQKHKRGFFRNFKLSFKSRRVKSLRGSDDFGNRWRGMSEDVRSTHNCNDTTEDILAKYRRKPSAGGDSTVSEPGTELKAPQLVGEVEDERLRMDPTNIESSYAFIDAKRKLRMVLSTADLQHVPWATDASTHMRESRVQKENELVSFLRLQLAEAINLQDRSLIAHLHETLRCIQLFDDSGCQKLFKSLKEDYQKRSPYIAYLVRCRQGLLSTLAHLERLTERLKCDRQVCSRFLVAVCVTMFLEKREEILGSFTVEFQQLTLADEKTDLLDNFLHTLSLEMDKDPTWQAASSTQLEQARTAVERAVISRVYTHALYPNGDGDVSRDQVLYEHMKKLSNVITPNHKDLRIPKVFHYECPWPSAQAEISAMAAYKTPCDKLQCVFRCATTIMNLLSMASGRGVPAADDFVPVLVYVLIKANPPSLLSTVQYVNSFYGNRLKGEEQYWWIQFCSAIEFIKTMDYSD
ncbi:receptor-mediated endocytosis protein 6 homolog isoform X2 [Zootermopsis nevadensis]|uniref:receptor-mediated endocytosis protein 6 homolog isoform X2 n=1 Tax=Zootermopsis nevadensis TaxID=136037 RepID=UPI000B8E4F35|nr:receptor-mediated endocytosis protein 6 homolog isoform X2 [Zootermopsis nevadensis]